jgi:hypothetical protein
MVDLFLRISRFTIFLFNHIFLSAPFSITDYAFEVGTHGRVSQQRIRLPISKTILPLWGFNDRSSTLSFDASFDFASLRAFHFDGERVRERERERERKKEREREAAAQPSKQRRPGSTEAQTNLFFFFFFFHLCRRLIISDPAGLKSRDRPTAETKQHISLSLSLSLYLFSGPNSSATKPM